MGRDRYFSCRNEQSASWNSKQFKSVTVCLLTPLNYNGRWQPQRQNVNATWLLVGYRWSLIISPLKPRSSVHQDSVDQPSVLALPQWTYGELRTPRCCIACAVIFSELMSSKLSVVRFKSCAESNSDFFLCINRQDQYNSNWLTLQHSPKPNKFWSQRWHAFSFWKLEPMSIHRTNPHTTS